MKNNVGRIDRILRIVSGIAIISAGLYFQSWWAVLGLIPIFTGSIGWCPAYLPFRFSSCVAKKKKG